MKRTFVVILLCLLSMSSFAVTSRDVSSTAFDSLSEADKLSIMQKIEEKKAAMTGGDAATTVNKVSAWVQIGSDVGKGLAGAAKELGVAANEFANTSVGKLTVALIVWHFMGNMVLHVFGGIIVVILGVAFIRMYRSSCRNVAIEYEGSTWWGAAKAKKITYGKMEDGDLILLWVSSFVILVAWAITTFTGH